MRIALGALKGMTIVTPDIEETIAAYRAFLDYAGSAPEPVGAVRARRWRTPAAENVRMAVLRPISGGDRFLRFVEGDPGDYRPFMSFGWAAAEIVVGDLDRVAVRLASSPFKVIGEPAVLDFEFTDQIRAMQVEGPAGEVLYLTEIGAEIPGFDLPRARGLIGELFIAVLGGPSIERMSEGYAALERPAGPAIEARIEVLSNAHRLPAATKHRLSTIALPERSLIEIDAFPPGSMDRAPSGIGLPSGIAMASFGATIDGRPLDRPQVITGPAGELIELLP